ncbi:ATP-binding protein [Bordetella genomosp. 12]|uniref:Sensory/regulatory protein RpfC n=1 Tax=Bordetella genomosp. 12 TaxID=463035 RepID=A0A261VUA4_9BORD|nr:ATP-binding protein [Bordetella genomosp. 12]OZI77688.1 hypothetical protein CAL22_03925 [Bordetella genomosp. 12]
MSVQKSEPSPVLARLRRYQHALLIGGGVIITASIIVASLVEIGASAQAYLTHTKEAIEEDVRRSFDVTTQAIATLRQNVGNIESAWAEASRAQPDAALALGQDNVLRVQPTPDVPPLLVIHDGGTPDAAVTQRFAQVAQRMAATASAAAARNGGSLAAYVFSPDKKYIILSALPWGGPPWQDRILKNPPALFAALTSSDGQDITFAPSAEGLVSTAAPRMRWLPPYRSPLSGRDAVRIAAQLKDADGGPIGTLVYEMPLTTLLELLPSGAVGGACLLLASDHSEVARCPADARFGQSQAGTADLQHVDPSSGKGLALGAVMKTWPFGPTGWTLVHVQSWREILAGVRDQVAVTVATSVLIIALVWVLLLLVKRRVLTPAVRQSQRVFDSEQLSRTLVQTAPVGLGLIAREDGEVLLHSPAMAALTAKVNEAGGSLPQALLQNYREQNGDAEAAAPPAEPRILRSDLVFPLDAGRRLDLSVGMVGARYQGQEVLVAAITDVTRNKELEIELSNARLAAEHANAAKSAFLAAMSHEIRTPLNAILGNLELLTYSPLNETQRDRLDVIRSASGGLMALVDDVLDFSKIEAGELALEDLDYDLMELAADALRVFAPLAKDKGLALHGELGAEVALPMRGDPLRVRQVLNNLLSNAIKFTATGAVTLQVARDDARSEVTVTVTDTGIGMTAGQVQELFQDFRQMDPSIGRRFGGTGLGLALCRRLTHAMQGTLVARSRLGEGSAFAVTLPRGAFSATLQPPRFEGQRILLLTAAPAERDAVSQVLAGWGLLVAAYGHPALVQTREAEDAEALVFWGGRETWHPEDERRLADEASWVIDGTEDGPGYPIASGRVVAVSTFGLRALADGLRYALLGEAPAVREAPLRKLAQRLRVLVVEDNAFNRQLFMDQLELLGCLPTAAHDAGAALEQLTQAAFDVLLTDLAMPGRDGFSLTRLVRQRWPDMPVLAATANVTPQKLEQAGLAGISRVLAKPVSLAELAGALAQLAGPGRVDSAAAGPGPLGGRPLPEETWRAYVQACEASVQRLQFAAKRGDVDTLLAELHSVQGACRVFGFDHIGACCAQAEHALRQRGALEDPETVQALCDALQATATRDPACLSNQAQRLDRKLRERAEGSADGGAHDTTRALSRILLASLRDLDRTHAQTHKA